MPIIVLRAYLELIRVDRQIRQGDFAGVCARVHGCRIGNTTTPHKSVDEICAAVDLACIWYWKEVLCLQRAATTACLLKGNGISAELVIGAKQMPFRSHAWVEAGGRVVNDKPYVREIFGVLDRC